MIDRDEATVATRNPYGATPPPNSGLWGAQLNGMDIGLYLFQAGMENADELMDALAVFMAESDWYSMAFHHNLDSAGKILSTDWGFAQINDMAHPNCFVDGNPTTTVFVPQKCAEYAVQIWRADGFDPWVAYSSGAYLNDSYIERAGLALMNMQARRLVQMKSSSKIKIPMINVRELEQIYPPTT